MALNIQDLVKAELVLHGGERFPGYSFGHEESIAGEVVFSTGMVGYPESLTDPSYQGQILVLTTPMVGNYGVPPVEEDCFGLTKYFESFHGKIHVSGVLVQQYCEDPDHWESCENLSRWLRRHRIPGMMMVDTRSIVLRLREMGTALGKLIINAQDVPFIDPNTRNLVAEVSTRTRATYGHGTLIILVIDMGVKLNSLRCLLKYDVTLVVVPHDWDITTEVYDGLFISNGPGNPQLCTTTIRNVRWALQQTKPIFGICMGNQMLALAAGGMTYKMKYGHRGQNQPCKCSVDGKVVITTQNHGFAVDFKSMPQNEWLEYFTNSNDFSNEGLIHRTKPFFSTQFHPEGRCGPQDTAYLFREFVEKVKASKVKEMATYKPSKVLVLGAGGIVIAQAGEFDYSGSQCLKSLREEGVETVLINPNIATVQTDDEMADHIYFVPLTPEAVEVVIEKERPDSIMLGWGGQTALNCGLELDRRGVLQKYNIQVLGTPISVIAITEDRELFRDSLLQIDEHVAKSIAVTSMAGVAAAAEAIGFPMMVRAAFCLGGQGSGIVHNARELHAKVQTALAIAPQVLLEQSVAGWKEIEYEVVRDIYDNCVTVCNMENFDPMGIHTGESIVVAPSQTLSNDEFHLLRSASIKIIRHLGIVGECNIQYALEPNSCRYVVIEVNARLSRSSSLASKATGYPLAHVAAKIALGKALFEIKNGVTKSTVACFEPSLDYIAVKVPRWDLSKFNLVSEAIGSVMKSVGEVMAIGRTFEEAIQKALRMVNPEYLGFEIPKRFEAPGWDYLAQLAQPTPYRIFALCRALQEGHTVADLHARTGITKFFLSKLDHLVKLRRATVQGYRDRLATMPRAVLWNLKAHGFSDLQLAGYLCTSHEEIRARRLALGVMPFVKQIDTVAGEYPAVQCCYLYTTYNAEFDDVDFGERFYAVLGCGVYRIGNSVEFDYAGVLVVRELRRLGNRVMMLNSNPETVSTDYDECDRLYFDEVSEEVVLDIFHKERVKGVVISLGGQIVQNMALRLKAHGLPILGTDPANIDCAEDRSKFSQMCDDLGVPQPEWVSAVSIPQVLAFCERVGYPTLVRPSYVLSGSAIAVIANAADAENYLREASLVSGVHPVVVSKYYEEAMEYDVDIVAHHGRVLCYAICEHVEQAGVHSGDATMFLPPQNTDKETMKKIYDSTIRIAERLDVVGPLNLQFLLTREKQLRVIEANVRSSRSVPFVSKALGISFPEMMVSAFLARKEQDLVPIKRAKMTHIGCKASVFSFNRLAGADPIVGVEMTSTGEVGVFGRDPHEVFLKAMSAQNVAMPRRGVFFACEDAAKEEGLARALSELAPRLRIYCAGRNSATLRRLGIPHAVVAQRDEAGNFGDDVPLYDDAVARKELFDFVIQIRDRRADFMLRRCTAATAPPGYWVRRLAVDYNIPLLTEAPLVRWFCAAYAKFVDRLDIQPFRDYVPKIYHRIENNNYAVLSAHKVGLMIADNNLSRVLAVRLGQENIDLTCFHAYLGGNIEDDFERSFDGLKAPVAIVDLRSEIADGAFELITCQSADERRNWHLSKLAWHIIGKRLLTEMRERRITVVAQVSSHENKVARVEQYVKLYAPMMGVYNAWRDTRLMEDCRSEAEQLAILRQAGMPPSRRTDGLVHSSVCGNTYYFHKRGPTEGETSPGGWPEPRFAREIAAHDGAPEFVSLHFRAARCVGINGVDVAPLLALQMANEIAARNGVGVVCTDAAMFEAPGMNLLSQGLKFLYEVYFNPHTEEIFTTYSRLVAQGLALGQYSELYTQSAVEAIRFLTANVAGVVELELNQGEVIFLKLSKVALPATRRIARMMSAEGDDEIFQPGNGSFSDIQW
ncbi:unnamed protein product [Phytomonas sp. Hart1]|nr:unnamed protein product [Phytomonas sp. Hart1]|eukprot:CCW71701.1 unnamed protein product [Phytomonas sp. isolate Hart1]